MISSFKFTLFTTFAIALYYPIHHGVEGSDKGQNNKNIYLIRIYPFKKKLKIQHHQKMDVSLHISFRVQVQSTPFLKKNPTPYFFVISKILNQCNKCELESLCLFLFMIQMNYCYSKDGLNIMLPWNLLILLKITSFQSPLH